MDEKMWSIGIDIGGTKIELACVDADGKILHRKKIPSNVAMGPDAIQKDIVDVVKELEGIIGKKAVAVGLGMAGQIIPSTGVVKFAPNLRWHNVPLQGNLSKALNLPVTITNDVRAATWGEWFHGSGRGCQDLVCIFIGTGIGGGIVSGGRILTGANNSAGELGHVVIKINGPACTCGNRGCLEALAGGWAVAKQAQVLIEEDPNKGAAVLKLANDRLMDVTPHHVLEAATAGDPLASQLVENVIEAITAGCVGFVNAFNPSRLILGGGLGSALPNLVAKVEAGVRKQALLSATENLEVMSAGLQNDAGVVGAATLALSKFGDCPI